MRRLATPASPTRRTPRSAKSAGSTLERKTANHLAAHVDDRIDRKVRTGAKDTGDIGGVRLHGQRLVIECKDYGGRLHPAEWIREAHVEAGNDDALTGIVVAKRAGRAYPGDQWVLMTVDDLVAFLTGERPVSVLEASAR
ncbi:hypothetical protein DBT52_09645 [Aerococcus mictus]|nr:hypothetical protein DBT52_09645 [Aerococcus mictus]